MPLQQTAFWKHSDKRRNCTELAISPFATMFSTFCHRLSIQLWIFSMFWQNAFKVVCCRIVVWGKGLTNSLEASYKIKSSEYLSPSIFGQLAHVGTFTASDNSVNNIIYMVVSKDPYHFPTYNKSVAEDFWKHLLKIWEKL